MVNQPINQFSQSRISSSRVVLIAAILIIGVLGLVLFFKPNFLYTPIPTPTVPVSIPPASPSTNQTSTWQTYTNEQYAYSFQLPATWQETKPSSENSTLTTFLAPDESALEIAVTKNTTSSLEEYLARLDTTSSQAWEGQPARRVLESTNTVVNKYPAKARKEEWLAAGFTTWVTYVAVDEQVFSFSILPYGADEFSNTEVFQNYAPILASFRVE